MISFEGFVLEDSGPVYLQIMRYIRQGIAAGAIGDREEVPSRRALSALLGVNPNTIQKAYHMLEEEGILQSRSGAKSYTNVDRDTIERIRREQLRSETSAWVKAMKQMGVSWEEAEALAEEPVTVEDVTLDQGRDVFALPGLMGDPRCEGGNLLIRDGAGLITDVWDILGHYAAAFPHKIRNIKVEEARRFGGPSSAREERKEAPRGTRPSPAGPERGPRPHRRPAAHPPHPARADHASRRHHRGRPDPRPPGPLRPDHAGIGPHRHPGERETVLSGSEVEIEGRITTKRSFICIRRAASFHKSYRNT